MDPHLFEQEPAASKSRWKINKREILHKNRWHEYRHDAGLTEEGKPFDYYYVYYANPSAVVVALTEDKEMILVRQYRYVVGQDSLQIPGGRVKNSSTQQIAAQELREETGYEAGELRHIGSLDYAPAHSTDKVELFLATNCRRVADQDLEDTEAGMTVEVLPIADVYQRAEQGLIDDTLTLAALLIARPHLPRQE